MYRTKKNKKRNELADRCCWLLRSQHSLCKTSKLTPANVETFHNCAKNERKKKVDFSLGRFCACGAAQRRQRSDGDVITRQHTIFHLCARFPSAVATVENHAEGPYRAEGTICPRHQSVVLACRKTSEFKKEGFGGTVIMRPSTTALGLDPRIL